MCLYYFRWLKLSLENAGIDTNIFTGHSYRLASTSKANNLGVSFEVTLRTADWKHSGTFRKFYKKEVSDKDMYSRTILAT